jgi:hypothetical protein
METVMSNVSEKERLMSLLFEDGTQLMDLKLFLSLTPPAGGITPEDISREMKSAIEQKRAGTATISKSFGDDAAKVDVRTLFRT